MIHNDVLRRLRFALAINDSATISIFNLVDYDMDADYLHAIMKREDEQGFLPCRDKILALFLDGLIIKQRGKQEGHTPQPLEAGTRLSNNDILRKIRIAMSYKDDDMIAVLKLAGFGISKGELSAFFRKPDHRNFKPAGDQVVRNLLQGMVKKHRPETTIKTPANESCSGSVNSKVRGVHKRSSGPGKAKKGAVTHNAMGNKNNNNQENTVERSAHKNTKDVASTSVWGKISKPSR